MIPYIESDLVGLCLEGFFYGLYSGIFVIYLQCTSRSSRTANILFYALCLLYVLSSVTFASDLAITLELRFNTLSPQVQIHSELLRLHFIIQSSVSGSCDFIAQCITIYRCWIIWGKNIGVVIIPSFLAITFLATRLAPDGKITLVDGHFFFATWMCQMTITSFALSMAVHALVTGLIVFKILKVFLEVQTTSVERTMGSTRNTMLRHIIFVIIESAMMLFAIQLIRIVLGILPSVPNSYLAFIVGINEMFNGIAPTLILVRVSMRLSFEDKESFKEAAESICFKNTPSDHNTLEQMGRSNSLLSPGQEPEWSEDICFADPSNIPNTLGRIGSTLPPHWQESEDT